MQISKENQRKRARERYFDILLRESGYRCQYCNERVVRIADVKDALVKQYGRTVVIRINTGLVTRRIATLDHVIPLSEGGGREMDNLKIACSSCNQKKDKVYKSGKKYV